MTDQGLWEVRGPAQHFTASKVLCWVAADRGAKLAQLRGDEERAAVWRKAADEIHADVCAHGLDDRGVFCQHYGTTALDASALLIPLVGFLPPEDKRVRSTVLAIADELSDNELVLRYRVEGVTGPDPAPGAWTATINGATGDVVLNSATGRRPPRPAGPCGGPPARRR